MPKSRIINLYDEETNLLVCTNAPAEKIKEALAHKNKMLMDNDPAFRSDFEEMRDFLSAYTFKEIGYVENIEGYYW